MYTVIVITIAAFYLSLIGLILMIWLKRKEVVSGKITVLSKLARKSDLFFHNIFLALGRVQSRFSKQTFIAITQWIAFHVLYRVRRIYVELKMKALSNPHSKKVLDAVRGKAEINPAGASFYLRRISGK